MHWIACLQNYLLQWRLLSISRPTNFCVSCTCHFCLCILIYDNIVDVLPSWWSKKECALYCNHCHILWPFWSNPWQCKWLWHQPTPSVYQRTLEGCRQVQALWMHFYVVVTSGYCKLTLDIFAHQVLLTPQIDTIAKAHIAGIWSKPQRQPFFTPFI